MTEQHVLICDTETTGVNIKTAGICQISAVLLTVEFDEEWSPVNHKVMTLMSTLCNPGHPIPKEASDIHGTTNEMVRLAPPDHIAVNQLARLTEELSSIFHANGEDFFLGSYNGNRFDFPLLNARDEDSAHIFDKVPKVDAFMMAYRTYPELGHKLGEMYTSLLGREPENAHDAVYDCLMTAEVLVELLRARGKGLHEASAWCDTPQVLTSLPFGKHKAKPMKEVPLTYINWALGGGLRDISDDLLLTLETEVKRRRK